MGAVYLGRDPDLDRRVAIKVLREPMADEELLQRFLREARAAANLRHENLITIYEVGSHDQQPFIAMEYVDGIEFSSGGLSSPDDPAILVRDLTGAVVSWIEIGTPNADRLHRASKAARRVAVYVHRDPAPYLARLAGERIHRAGTLGLWGMDLALVAALGARLDRRMSFSLAIADRELFLSIGTETLTGQMTRLGLRG